MTAKKYAVGAVVAAAGVYSVTWLLNQFPQGKRVVRMVFQG